MDTARDRLQRGRGAEGRAYLMGLVNCPEAWTKWDWWALRAEAHEAEGELHAAWLAAGRAVAVAIRSALPKASESLSFQRGFLARYTRVVAAAGAGPPPVIRYAGPLVDEVTLRQLDEVALGRAVDLGDGTRGYFLVPGTYAVDGRTTVLEAGQVLRLVAPPGDPDGAGGG